MSEPRSVPGFRAIFGREPELRASAPGRVNLIGEHTDYNGGFVLPAAIPQRTRVELARRDDGAARVWSANVGGAGGSARFELGREAKLGTWLDYVQGITKVLRDEGHAIGGFEAWIASDVPVGSGLSSSAALEVALLRALREAFALPIDDVRIALLGQRVENDFVGAPVGVMDQMAASLAGTEAALFLDTRTLGYEIVPIPAEIELIVINSGIAHSHAAGDYRTRRAECERAAELLGVALLRDVGIADLDRIAALPEPLARRARHVVTENDRVLGAVAAMRAGDVATLGRLFDASHASMRDDFEVSIPEIDLLVELTRAEPGVAGARLTGGGFGGSIVALAPRGEGARVAARVAAAYQARSGRQATVLVPEGHAASAQHAA